MHLIIFLACIIYGAKWISPRVKKQQLLVKIKNPLVERSYCENDCQKFLKEKTCCQFLFKLKTDPFEVTIALRLLLSELIYGPAVWSFPKRKKHSDHERSYLIIYYASPWIITSSTNVGRTVFEEHGLGEEVINAVSQFIGIATSEVQVFSVWSWCLEYAWRYFIWNIICIHLLFYWCCWNIFYISGNVICLVCRIDTAH